jgi:hypothetical protein
MPLVVSWAWAAAVITAKASAAVATPAASFLVVVMGSPWRRRTLGRARSGEAPASLQGDF